MMCRNWVIDGLLFYINFSYLRRPVREEGWCRLQYDTQCYFWYRVNVVWTGSMLESKAGNVAQWASGRERTGLLPGRHATFTRWQASRKTSRASLEQLISIFAVSISRFRVCIYVYCVELWIYLEHFVCNKERPLCFSRNIFTSP